MILSFSTMLDKSNYLDLPPPPYFFLNFTSFGDQSPLMFPTINITPVHSEVKIATNVR